MSATSPPLAIEPESGVNQENPWPGLAVFTEDLSQYFFGRDEEIVELFRLVKRETLTVLFGQSGLGKSSLLQAGLFPKLRQANFVPVYVRLDHDENAPPLAAQVRAALRGALAASEVEAPTFPDDETMWEYFHRKDVDFWNAKNRLATPVLVFDQFEEIFTLGRGNEARRARGQVYLTELANLIENRPSVALKEKLENGSADAGRYFFDREFCKVMFSLREDYLPDLEGLRPILRSVLQNRLRITRLRAAEALQAVSKPGAALLEDSVAERIVQFVAGSEEGARKEDAEREVDPALLNVVCRELNNRRVQAKQPKITADLLAGNRREILSEFYERSLRDLPPAVRVFVEDRLLTKSGFRDNVALDNALSELGEHGVTRDAIDRLVNRRLLRLEERLGVARVELTHDVLTGVIRASRDARKEKEALAALDETRRRAARERRRARTIVAAVSLALVLAVVSTVIALLQRNQAQNQALARRLAAQADTVLRLPEKPVELGVLLAVESMQHSVTFEGDRALRLGLSLLPRAAGRPIGESNVNAIALSSNGNFVVTSSSDKLVSVWEVATATKTATLLHDEMVDAVAVSLDATILATGSKAKTRLWRGWQTPTPTNFAAIPGPALAFAFTTDGEYLAIGGTNHEENVRVFHLTGGVVHMGGMTHRQEGAASSVGALAFASDGNYLASGGQSSRQSSYRGNRDVVASVWEWKKGREVVRIPCPGIRVAAGFSQDNDDLWIASGIDVRKYSGWKSSNMVELARKDLNYSVTLSPNGRYLASMNGRVWEKWESADEFSEIARLAGAKSVVFNPGGELLAAVSETNVQVWAMAGHHEVARLEDVASGSGYFYRFSRDSLFLAVAGGTNLRVCNLVTRQPYLLSSKANLPAFSPDGEYLAAATEDGIDIWKDWQSGRANRIAKMALGQVESIEFTPDGRYLAVMQDDLVQLWEDWHTRTPLKLSGQWPPGERLKVLSKEDLGDGAGAAAIAFSLEGKYLSATHHGVVRVWKDWNTVRPLQVVVTNIPGDAIGFTADGKYFVAAEEDPDDATRNVVLVSKLLGRRQLAKIIYDEPVRDVALSPDGKRLAIGSDGAAQVCDVATREKIINLPITDGRSPEAHGVLFSPDGRYLATYSAGGRVQIWYLFSKDLKDMARQRLTRNLTSAEWEQYFVNTPYRKTFPDLP